MGLQIDAAGTPLLGRARPVTLFDADFTAGAPVPAGWLDYDEAAGAAVIEADSAGRNRLKLTTGAVSGNAVMIKSAEFDPTRFKALRLDMLGMTFSAATVRLNAGLTAPTSGMTLRLRQSSAAGDATIILTANSLNYQTFATNLIAGSEYAKRHDCSLLMSPSTKEIWSLRGGVVSGYATHTSVPASGSAYMGVEFITNSAAAKSMWLERLTVTAWR